MCSAMRALSGFVEVRTCLDHDGWLKLLGETSDLERIHVPNAKGVVVGTTEELGSAGMPIS